MELRVTTLVGRMVRDINSHKIMLDTKKSDSNVKSTQEQGHMKPSLEAKCKLIRRNYSTKLGRIPRRKYSISHVRMWDTLLDVIKEVGTVFTLKIAYDNWSREGTTNYQPKINCVE